MLILGIDIAIMICIGLLVVLGTYYVLAWTSRLDDYGIYVCVLSSAVSVTVLIVGYAVMAKILDWIAGGM